MQAALRSLKLRAATDPSRRCDFANCGRASQMQGGADPPAASLQ
jgi:hypothetical protein